MWSPRISLALKMSEVDVQVADALAAGQFLEVMEEGGPVVVEVEQGGDVVVDEVVAEVEQVLQGELLELAGREQGGAGAGEPDESAPDPGDLRAHQAAGEPGLEHGPGGLLHLGAVAVEVGDEVGVGAELGGDLLQGEEDDVGPHYRLDAACGARPGRTASPGTRRAAPSPCCNRTAALPLMSGRLAMALSRMKLSGLAARAGYSSAVHHRLLHELPEGVLVHPVHPGEMGGTMARALHQAAQAGVGHAETVDGPQFLGAPAGKRRSAWRMSKIMSCWVTPE